MVVDEDRYERPAVALDDTRREIWCGAKGRVIACGFDGQLKRSWRIQTDENETFPCRVHSIAVDAARDLVFVAAFSGDPACRSRCLAAFRTDGTPLACRANRNGIGDIALDSTTATLFIYRSAYLPFRTRTCRVVSLGLGVFAYDDVGFLSGVATKPERDMPLDATLVALAYDVEACQMYGVSHDGEFIVAVGRESSETRYTRITGWPAQTLVRRTSLPKQERFGFVRSAAIADGLLFLATRDAGVVAVSMRGTHAVLALNLADTSNLKSCVIVTASSTGSLLVTRIDGHATCVLSTDLLLLDVSSS